MIDRSEFIGLYNVKSYHDKTPITHQETNLDPLGTAASPPRLPLSSIMAARVLMLEIAPSSNNRSMARELIVVGQLRTKRNRGQR